MRIDRSITSEKPERDAGLFRGRDAGMSASRTRVAGSHWQEDDYTLTPSHYISDEQMVRAAIRLNVTLGYLLG